MMLLVRGTDIREITLGLSRNGIEWGMVTLPARPEDYLACLQKFLEQQQCRQRDIQEVIVVAGEGSATAVRASVTMVNALSWAANWRVRELIVPTETAESELPLLLQTAEAVPLARPHYAASPHITQSTHDALKRKL